MLMLLLLLPLPLLLLVSPIKGKVNRHRYPRTVQSAACNLLDPRRKFGLRGPVDKKFPDLDDGEEELVGLGLDGS